MIEPRKRCCVWCGALFQFPGRPGSEVGPNEWTCPNCVGKYLASKEKALNQKQEARIESFVIEHWKGMAVAVVVLGLALLFAWCR